MKKIVKKNVNCIVFSPLKSGISYIEKYFNYRKNIVNFIEDKSGLLNFANSDEEFNQENQIFRVKGSISKLKFSKSKLNIHYSPYNFSLPQQTVENIKNINADYKQSVKAIILLRNPGERILEHHEFFRRNNWERYFFRDAVSTDNAANRINNKWDPLYNYIDCSLYYEKVCYIMENFDNVKIIYYDEIQVNKDKVFENICDFLNIKYKSYAECFICKKVNKFFDRIFLPFYKFFFKHSEKIKFHTDGFFSEKTKINMLENSKKLYRNKILEEKHFSKDEIININYLFFHDDILNLYDKINNPILIKWIRK
ncbi:MAG: hypothetical protein M0R46_00055 [Candidatus Muirbacterium halophilum]|nr:hypothetical protein [Candidatus Muirbacterium halophilum]MCK9474284.1 hypothetical protein [Candidatus Muirbacterium halophilum]